MPPPAADRMPATFREWVEILARVRFGKVRAAGKTVAGSTIKAVANRLAAYADTDGTRVRPGVARVAVDLEIDYSTARRAVSILRGFGLLDLVRAGGRRGVDEYRLTLPVDLLDRDDLTVWSPTEQKVQIERLRGVHRGFPEGPGSGGSQIPEGSAMEEASQIPQGSAQAISEPSITDPSGTPKTSITDPSGTRSVIPEGSATDQDRYTTTTDHLDGDLEAAVTHSRVSAPATNPESPSRPQRCDHGLSGALRSDGRPACALCRVAEDRPATHLAPVIQFRPREAS